MKDQQRQLASTLYLTSDFTITEIANHLGISRRSIQLWAKKENWNTLRDHISQHAETQNFASIRNITLRMSFFNSMFPPPATTRKQPATFFTKIIDYQQQTAQ